MEEEDIDIDTLEIEAKQLKEEVIIYPIIV